MKLYGSMVRPGRKYILSVGYNFRRWIAGFESDSYYGGLIMYVGPFYICFRRRPR